MNKEKINKFGTLTEIMDDIVETDEHGNNHIKPDRIIPLIYDREFTYVLNKTNCIGFLECMISDITKIPIEEIRGKITLENRDLLRDTKTDKEFEVDVLATYRQIRLNIEANNYNDSMNKLGYKARILSSQYVKGKRDYTDIKMPVQINFNNHNALKNRVRLVEKYVSYCEEIKMRSLYDLSETYEIDMEKALDPSYNYVNELEERFRLWSKLLRTSYKDDFRKLGEELMGKEITNKVMSEMDNYSGNANNVSLFLGVSKMEAAHNTEIINKDEELKAKDDKIQEQANTIQEQGNTIQEQGNTIQEQAELIAELQSKLKANHIK